MLIAGLRFILDKIAAAVDAELHDDAPLRERLLEAQMRLELGEIDEAAFREIERDMLARMRELKGPQNALTMSPGDRLAGVEVETFDEGDHRQSGGNGAAPEDGVMAAHPAAGDNGVAASHDAARGRGRIAANGTKRRNGRTEASPDRAIAPDDAAIEAVRSRRARKPR